MQLAGRCDHWWPHLARHMISRNRNYLSWGRYPKLPPPTEVYHLRWADQPLPASLHTLLPYGNGRSYGDCCLNDGEAVLDVRGLDRFLSFDRETGVLRCEAGILLADILNLTVPFGWFLTVTPGTRFVTIGGAIANDVHGKNHHRTGTFGSCVRSIGLRRSDLGLIQCSQKENRELFHATIAGLGLTGVILWAEIQLRPIQNPVMDVETIRFPNLEAFFDLSDQSDQDYEYTVAWIDCLARGNSLGRGLFIRGNHASSMGHTSMSPENPWSIPFDLPFPIINRWSLKAFNSLYYRKQLAPVYRTSMHYERFFYPLDGILHWNRMYGQHGFLQYQCVVPQESARESIRSLLEVIATARMGSFLSVLKIFGDHSSPGLLSFPRPGVTLALDFPNAGSRTLELLDHLDKIVEHSRGAVYPAKDARVSAMHFQEYFPRWKEFECYIDPRFSSSFWRRVSQTSTCAI